MTEERTLMANERADSTRAVDSGVLTTASDARAILNNARPRGDARPCARSPERMAEHRVEQPEQMAERAELRTEQAGQRADAERARVLAAAH